MVTTCSNISNMFYHFTERTRFLIFQFLLRFLIVEIMGLRTPRGISTYTPWRPPMQQGTGCTPKFPAFPPLGGWLAPPPKVVGGAPRAVTTVPPMTARSAPEVQSGWAAVAQGECHRGASAEPSYGLPNPYRHEHEHPWPGKPVESQRPPVICVGVPRYSCIVIVFQPSMQAIFKTVVLKNSSADRSESTDHPRGDGTQPSWVTISNIRLGTASCRTWKCKLPR